MLVVFQLGVWRSYAAVRQASQRAQPLACTSASLLARLVTSLCGENTGLLRGLQERRNTTMAHVAGMTHQIMAASQDVAIASR